MTMLSLSRRIINYRSSTKNSLIQALSSSSSSMSIVSATTKRTRFPINNTVAVNNYVDHDMMLRRSFSSTSDVDNFQPEQPEAINYEMAEGIQEGTLFYIRNGVPYQRLRLLSDAGKGMDIVLKWQKMMEIYLSTQVMVLSGLGYSPDEKGLQAYTMQLAEFINNCDEASRENFKSVGTETWRELVSTAFDLDLENIKPLSIVDARNIMHKVSSKMQSPEVLTKISKLCARIDTHPDPDVDVAQKHQILQQIIVNDVYLGGSPSIVEESGFGKGDEGYAHMQCVMAEHESDPMIASYASSAMVKLWTAAGLDMSHLQQAQSRAVPTPTPSKS